MAAPGLLGEHIHVTTDGECAIVVTEWTDAAAQEAATTDGFDVKQYTLHHAFLNDRPGPLPLRRR
ncbi:hypothetical protein ACFXKR_01870 [Streptomyces violascens]|uniref:hypothetical protein n=1 Tax=Streptomyces violascens TaxID=67381 RepID=UPI00367DC31D